jgi:hypothetical protein
MPGLRTDRRSFLQSALTASAFVMGAAAVRRATFAVDKKSARHFFSVKISRDRVIRSVVGLRPYRSEGFVVKADRLGEKVVIHNYGHGGAGITLSWRGVAGGRSRPTYRPSQRRCHGVRCDWTYHGAAAATPRKVSNHLCPRAAARDDLKRGGRVLVPNLGI